MNVITEEIKKSNFFALYSAYIHTAQTLDYIPLHYIILHYITMIFCNLHCLQHTLQQFAYSSYESNSTYIGIPCMNLRLPTDCDSHRMRTELAKPPIKEVSIWFNPVNSL